MGLPADVIEKAYKAFWLYIRETIKEFPLKDGLEKDEFDKLRTNFNIPNLGKLSCTYEEYVNVMNRYKQKDRYVEYQENKTNG